MRTALFASLLACGCSGSATLKLRDGSKAEGRILRSSAESVWIERGNDAPVELRREDIVDVTHPGTWEMVVGGGLLSVSAIALGMYANSKAQQDSCDGGCGRDMSGDWLFLLTAPPGVILLTDGVFTYYGSVDRYAGGVFSSPTAASRTRRAEHGSPRLGFEL